jgi:2-amino-4-hydroxy-6-hydroxymethyldihydropteridine diphosphokinase
MHKQSSKSYIALGSNIDDPIANVQLAIKKLSEKYKLCAASSLYLTKPWGYLDQPDFINAVVLIETESSAQQLLKEIQTIEKEMGRERVIHWGPRIIDLDILTYDNERIDEPDLQIPHPHMLERAFVLDPLAEIDNAYLEALNKLPAKLRQEVQKLSHPTRV